MRFRVGPVRFGGGRKASVTAGIGPFGVTVGGGRRNRSSGGGGAQAVQVNVIDWNTLSFEEKLYVPLREMRHVVSTAKSLPLEDQAIIYYKKQVSEDNQSQAAVLGLKYGLPWLLPLVGVFWLDAWILPMLGYFLGIPLSLITIRGVLRYKRISRLNEPSEKQLVHWNRVHQCVEAPERLGPPRPISSETLLETMTIKFGKDAMERLTNYVRRVPRYTMSFSDSFTLQMRTVMYGSVSLAASVMVLLWNFDRACHSGRRTYNEWNCENYIASEDITIFLGTYLVLPGLILGFLPEYLLKRRVHIARNLTVAGRYLISLTAKKIAAQKIEREQITQAAQRRNSEDQSNRLAEARERFRNSKRD